MCIRDSFLFSLACALNAGAIELAETLRPKALLLQEQLHTLLLRRAVSDDMSLLHLRLCRETPYPLAGETAAVVEAARRFGVETWELFQESEILEDWVRAQYVREGKTELPRGAHIPFTDPESIPPPSFAVPTEQEIRTLFPDEDTFRVFAQLRTTPVDWPTSPTRSLRPDWKPWRRPSGPWSGRVRLMPAGCSTSTWFPMSTFTICP